MNRFKFFAIWAIALFPLGILAQKVAPKNWHHLDPAKDKVWGVGTDRVYTEIKPVKATRPVVVAVIDGGTDINHEDLREMLWMNRAEVAENKQDDDGNGLADDVFGWNFIGGANGSVEYDNLEITRIYRDYKDVFDGDGSKNVGKTAEMKKMYDEAQTQHINRLNQSRRAKAGYDTLLATVEIVRRKAGAKDPSYDALKAVEVTTKLEKMAKRIAMVIAKQGGKEKSELQKQLDMGKDHYNALLDFQLNEKFDPRPIVGDDYSNVNERHYGNGAVNGPKAEHGTHVSGIIAAQRDNEKGIQGICADARIMTIRAVPDGDERDKDIANAIRYAVDNGAKIINMSFGKSLSPNKKQVDEAVKYALSKDVLLIHAAGNDHKNLAVEKNFPTAKFEGVDYTAPNWIEVGASSWEKGKKLTANFSNYGKEQVDVFAPGVDIYSTMPGNEYAPMSGTSMAAPVVSGVAALIRSQYPQLTAVQVKAIIERSAIPYNKKVRIPGTKKKVKLKELCKTGAVVNAYEALKLAGQVASGTVTL